MARDAVKKWHVRPAVLALLILVTGSAHAQSSRLRTYINPLDIDYKYNFEQLNERISYRSGADPAVVNHRGEYFMFVTVSGGYWHSRDLLSWRFVTPSRWPFEDIVAPAALSVRDTLYLLQSAFEPRPILFTTAPATGRLEFYNRRLPRLPNMLPPWRDIARVGPFTYAPYNPVSYKPGGFVTGAGHGNTFQDNYGNYWNTGTPWLAVNWNFERRIAMFPVGFDAEGQMFASTRFGDFPHYVPTRKWTRPEELFTGWMLLSYRKPATASSMRDTRPRTSPTRIHVASGLPPRIVAGKRSPSISSASISCGRSR
jgi:hypothetical protein